MLMNSHGSLMICYLDILETFADLPLFFSTWKADPSVIHSQRDTLLENKSFTRVNAISGRMATKYQVLRVLDTVNPESIHSSIPGSCMPMMATSSSDNNDKGEETASWVPQWRVFVPDISFRYPAAATDSNRVIALPFAPDAPHASSSQ